MSRPFRSLLFVFDRLLSLLAVAAVLALAGRSLAASGAPAWGGNLHSIRVWGDDARFAQSHITAIAQTPDGYLWLGSYGGLARFDGVRFEVFDSVAAPALRDGRISALFVASDGTLWIGHETGCITRFSHGGFSPVPADGSRNVGGVVGFGEDASHQIWTIGMQGTVHRTTDPVTEKAPPVVPDFVAGGADRAGNLWMSRNGTLQRLEKDKLVRVRVATDWLTDTVFGFAPGREGGIWISNEGRLQRWDHGTKMEDWGPAPWNTQSLTALIELRNGGIVAGTLDHGLYMWSRGARPVQIDATSGLTHNWVRSLYEDPEETLWVGTGGGGLLSIRDATFMSVQPPEGWQGRSVLAVNPARDGGVWVGTEGAGIFHGTGETWRHFGEPEGLGNLFVWSLAGNAAGEIMAGTWGGGVYRQSAENGFSSDARLASGPPVTAAFHSEKTGITWFGSRNGVSGVRASSPDLPTHASEAVRLAWPAALPAVDVRSITADATGTLWVGTLGAGLLAYAPDGNVRHYRTADGLPSDTIQCVLAAADGVLWVGTADGGIARLKDGHFAVVNSRQGLPGNSIGQILPDDQGYFWIASLAGIFRIKSTELNHGADDANATVNFQLFGRGDGLPAVQLAGGQSGTCRTADGLIWFCTTRGLVRVDPRHVPVNAVPPPLQIERMSIDGRPVARGREPVQVPAGMQRIQLGFTALSLAAPEKVRFRTRLLGLSDQWSEASPDREVVLHHLPPGDYRFEVIASNNDGVWATEPAGTAFTVRPFYWQTWWFRAALAVLIIGGASLASVWFARARLCRQLEALERQGAIERERSRIARDIHDDLGASLTRITLLTQTALAHASASPTTTQDLGRIYGTARELTRSMDEIVWAVSPRHDSLDSLATFLGKYAQDYLQVAGVRCRLDLPADLPAAPVSAEIRHNVYLATKEALHNIVKHAGASEVRLAVELVSGAIRVRIEDNGRGFPVSVPDAREQPGGNGLPNLIRRLAEIGGTCTVTSAVGAGTCTTFVIPLVSEPPDHAP